MIDGHETHNIPQMGRDKWWFEQYQQGKITREEWITSFLDNSPEVTKEDVVNLALTQGKLTLSEYLEYCKTGVIPPILLK